MTTRILIADDHAVFRSALKVLLEQENDLEVICETGTGHETVAAIDEHDIDVLLLDISMPGLSGPQVTQAVLKGSVPTWRTCFCAQKIYRGRTP
jgi:two-component system nitrate/nitrite response regulator NarL